MTLTKDDIAQIKEIVVEAVNDGFETLAVPRFDTIEKDVSDLKQDAFILKQDVSELKADVNELKSDVRTLNSKFDMLEGRVKGLERDIREIYMMLAKREAGAPSFNKLTLEQKIRATYDQLQIAAKEAGINLQSD
jgi:outer membrane murein-binding lipoprotein Lpp